MRRLILALLGAIAVIASLIPASAQASGSKAYLDRATVAVHSGNNLSITLPRHECGAALGRLSRGAADCAISASIRLSRISATDSLEYYSANLWACAVPENNGCNTHYWWVKDSFEFVQNQHSPYLTWAYGSPSCSANHTSYTWCSFVNNGTVNFEEGFNFGNGGWARMDISDIGICYLRGPSWVNVNGYNVDLSYGGEDQCLYTGQ